MQHDRAFRRVENGIGLLFKRARELDRSEVDAAIGGDEEIDGLVHCVLDLRDEDVPVGDQELVAPLQQTINALADLKIEKI